MAKDKDWIKIVERALRSGLGSNVRIFAEKSDYRDFIRLFVISDSFRRKSEKERLGEVFSTLEEYGAKDAIAKISLCVVMTRREYEREFGRGVFLGVDLHKTAREMKARPKVAFSRGRS